jgi:hypothetical protein
MRYHSLIRYPLRPASMLLLAQPRLKREAITVFTVNCSDFFENITNFGNLIVLQCKSEQPNQTDILVTANFFFPPNIMR